MKPKRFFFHQPPVFGSPLRCGVPLALGFMVFISGLDAEAGDILRGGGASQAGKPRAGANGGAPTPAATDAARANARDMLARTNRTMDSLRAMQNAARNAAAKGPNSLGKNPLKPTVNLPKVPNGLVSGGLKVSGSITTDPAAWTGAELPTQSVGKGRTKVTVKQTEQQALLNWETFNVGKNTTLTFDQSKGGKNVNQWIAFNKVSDPSANPTQILGSIKAQGQVYIINTNGIIFGGSSQVNAHALTAASLPINDNLIDSGLLNNPDQQFMFSALAIPAGKNGTPAFTPDLAPGTKIGDVTVMPGATLTSPSSAAKVGGRISLIGANVRNDGTIRTEDGQTILAAGLQVGFAAHSTSDPSLRGLDTFIGAVADPASTLETYAGSSINAGIIDAPRANITLAGKTVSQLGAIDTSTSVSLNGRIDLIASYDAIGNLAYNASNTSFGPSFLNRSTGTVLLGENSLTRILPELDSDEKTIGTELALRSEVHMTGQQIHFDNGSILLAPSAQVTGRAGKWLTVPSSSASNPPIHTFVREGGRIDVDAGAIIDVSGSENVQSSVTANIVEAQLRGAELSDSPLQRDGKLRGETVFVDVTKTGTYNGKTWIGTPLADVSGYVNLVQRTVGELTSKGGTVDFSAGDAVVIREGSTIDVSGGSVDYAGAFVRTSQVIEGRNIIDIADATPDRVYDGLFKGTFTVSHPKWNRSSTYKASLVPGGYRYQESYTQGGDGGSLKVAAGAIALDGGMKGRTYSGARQRNIGPAASLLDISYTSQRIVEGQVSEYSPNKPKVSFADVPSMVRIADFSTDANGIAIPLPAERLAEVTLKSSVLSDSAFGSIRIQNPDGEIVVPESVELETTRRGSITFGAANIDIGGSLTAVGGTLSFTTYNLSPSEIKLDTTLPLPVADRGGFHLGGTAVLSTAGSIVDDRSKSHSSLLSPSVITGGTVSIKTFSANMENGSVIDVSGGVQVSGTGGASYGNAGSISVLTGSDATLPSVTGGSFTLGSTLKGFSGIKGGSLTLGALAVNIGGAPSAGVLLLDPVIFSRGGFSTFNISGIGRQSAGTDTPLPGLVVNEKTRIAPEVRSLILDGLKSGQAPQLRTVIKPEGLRNPVSITLGATGTRSDINGLLLVRGDLVIGKGASIDAGPSGSITLKADTAAVHGTLSAVGGNIQITGASRMPTLGTPSAAACTVWIGSTAELDASGGLVLVPDAYGRRRGAVLDGGTVSLSGNIIAEAGARIDVSGGSGILDLTAGESGRSLAELTPGAGGTTTPPVTLDTSPVTVHGNGGLIRMTGGEMLLTDADLIGAAGGETAAGGTLQLSSGRFYPIGVFSNPFDPVFVVRNSGRTLPATLAGGIAATFTDDGAGVSGGGRFSADDFKRGGFSNLDIAGVVKFDGDVSIRARGRITAGTGPAVFATGDVNLRASRISLGTAFQKPELPDVAANFRFLDGNSQPVTLAPTYGKSRFTASADLIDVGYLSMQGIGEAKLKAAGGDVRGSGVLEISGRLGVEAAQIYPPTSLDFTIAAFDYLKAGRMMDGTVTITASGVRELPLSAGGTLSIHASEIRQNGVLRAPFGEIVLGWNGEGKAPHDVLSGLDFAASKRITLGAGSVTSVSAIDPLSGDGVTIPYGLSPDGSTWLDPRGVDITSGGTPQKRITISAGSVSTDKASDIDIRGGGDLLAYRWVKGQGGNTDILGSPGSFAVIPGYNSDFAPYAPFNTAETGGDPGYVSSNPGIGQQVELNGGGGLPAGTYTLLPARYALLPGAFLVTPLSGPAVGTIRKADGAAIVSGFRYQGQEHGLKPSNAATRFEVASAKVIRLRAEYTSLLGNAFFQLGGGLRLPGDAGQLVLEATSSMQVKGGILSTAGDGFRNGLIDISSPADILITDGKTAVPDGTLSLDAALLSGFGAESLLVGGVRTATAEGTAIQVSTGNLTVSNPDSALSGPEIILVANNRLVVTKGSRIIQTDDSSSGSGTLLLGNDDTAGSGNGALLRIGSNDGVMVVRKNFTPGTAGILSAAPDTLLRANGIILDSTSRTSVSETSVLDTSALSLSSGRISLLPDPGSNPGNNAGLVLTGSTLESLAAVGSLSLTSYSTIDILGSGTVGGVSGRGTPAIDNLSLSAAAIRNVGDTKGEVRFNASNIILDNRSGAAAPAHSSDLSGKLVFSGDAILLGNGSMALDGFTNTRLNASGSLQTTGDGALTATGDLDLQTPAVFSTLPASYRIEANGRLQAGGSGQSVNPPSSAGLGSQLELTGSSVRLDTRFYLPSGRITATAKTGNLTIGGTLETPGVTREFGKARRHTDGGLIELSSLHGNVLVESGALIDVSARPEGGSAGTAAFSAAEGSISLRGALDGSGGKSGNIRFDVGQLPSLAAIDSQLNLAGFGGERIYRVRSGDVAIDGDARAAIYQLSADSGSILVSGTIDASGETGGSVRLSASDNLRLVSGSKIDVSAVSFDSAGKGGAITLETRGANAGIMSLDTGSVINLGVDAARTNSELRGNFTGTLHLRVPRIDTDVALDAIGSTIAGASNIIVEGFTTYNLTGANAVITNSLRNTIRNEATAFIGDAILETGREDRILAGLGGSSGAIGSILTVRPGVEIVNAEGSLTLGGATTSGASGDWNLSAYRFGSSQVPGILTLRAAGDLVFFNTLSDGFTNATYKSGLMERNPLLPDNAQSWSYRLASGADFSSVDSLAVKSIGDLNPDSGSILLGKNGFSGIVTGGNNALTSTPLSNTASNGLFQVIRTGSGDIDVSAGRDIRLLNQFATIYTAGTLAADPTMGGKFQLPTPAITNNLQSGSLGAVQQQPASPVQYTLGGGNVSLSAGNDIIHLTKDSKGNLIADSERQMPVNWLYRRGFIDPATGEFGASRFGESASTTWWVDFTNFFEGVGALGGGNVTLDAGRDITNVDAAVPTNGRMPAGKPNASAFVELGGGDLVIRAGRNIDGGVYYAERGNGTLLAGSSITTNSTRSPSLTILSNPPKVLDPSLWLPTTLFLGKGIFDVKSAGDILLGPTVNPFLLPAGFNNTFWYKSYFSTYAPDSGVDVTSLGGDVTLRQSIAYEPGRATTGSTSILQRWFASELLLSNSSASFLQPWLRLSESSVTPFATAFTILPPSLKATSISGNLSLQGDFNLFPAPAGQLEMIAAGSIRGLNPAGIGNSGTTEFTLWADTRINLSDSDPAGLPGITSPFAYQTVSGTNTSESRLTKAGFLSQLDRTFSETGSTNGVLQQKQSLHAAGLLHASDENPSLLFAGTGDIDGLTLYSAKTSIITAGQDIRDVSLYIQNLSSGDTSVVSAGRDLIAYDSGTLSRTAARTEGNLTATGDGSEAGDIQIAGPGLLEVFAGRNLDLGTGGNNADGTGTGITSIGNGRNPYLPFDGASIIAGAGIGSTMSLADSRMDFPAFIDRFVLGGNGRAHLKELGLTRSAFAALDQENQRRIALEVFFLVLRDAGRDHNDPDKPGFGNYNAGKKATATLFPLTEDGLTWDGDIDTRARDIRTRNGGDITLFAPGGGLRLATSVIGAPLAPPGIITESGGSIHVFTDGDVDLGISRIFTLRGGDEIIWSSKGDIAAGSSSKTVQSAPPTRVLIDPQSADVQTDLAGLATGGGIGVLSTVAGVKPSDVDLIAPEGTIDAGDAGIRVSGNLNIAAAVVVNTANISVGGTSAGASASSVSAPSVTSITSSSNAAAAATSTAVENAADRQQPAPETKVEELPSLITVEVIGYGGGGGGSEEEEDEKSKEDTPPSTP